MTPVPPPSPVPDSDDDDAVSAYHPRFTVPARRIALLLLNVPLLAIFMLIWATQPSGQLVQGAPSPPTATSGQSSTFAPEGGGSPVATTNATANATGGSGGHSTATPRPPTATATSASTATPIATATIAPSPTPEPTIPPHQG